jgi:rhodanese-related sulfurtransferase
VAHHAPHPRKNPRTLNFLHPAHTPLQAAGLFTHPTFHFVIRSHPMKTAHDLVAAARTRVQEIAVADAETALRDADVLVDVREADEYAAGHIAGAVLVPRGLLEFRFSSTPALQPRDLKIVLYCKTSGRAALCGAALHEMGYLNVRSIAGGIDGWVAAGKPVVKPEAPSFE